MLQMLYFTCAGIALYLVADWLLLRLENWRGQPFRERTLVFFVIIFVLTTVVFNLIEMMTAATPALP